MIKIALADPREQVFRGFLQASDDYAAALYPAESNHLLDIATLLKPEMHFYGIWKDDVAVGCGGFWMYTDYVEIKRVWVAPSARGHGLSLALIVHLESAARDLGFNVARLETGVAQVEALSLYRNLGYIERSPFGGYKLDPLSVFMEKTL